MKTKPQKVGTVWTAAARIRFIDENAGKWVTVATCIDTPRHIGEALAKARGSHPGKTLWVHSDSLGKYIP